MTDPRDLIRRLADALAEWQLGGAPPEDAADAALINEARAYLATSEPASGPLLIWTEQLSDGAVRVCVGDRCGIVSGWHLVEPEINQLRQHQSQENTDDH